MISENDLIFVTPSDVEEDRDLNAEHGTQTAMKKKQTEKVPASNVREKRKRRQFIPFGVAPRAIHVGGGLSPKPKAHHVPNRTDAKLNLSSNNASRCKDSDEKVIIPSVQASGNAAVLDSTCEVCHSGEDDDNLLLCDACNAAHHTYCCDPPLPQVPAEEELWFCPPCQVKEDEEAAAQHVSRKKVRIPKSKAIAVKLKHPISTAVLDSTCEVCHSGEDDDNLLLCDACNAAHHTYCCDPPLPQVPAEEELWFCPPCQVKEDEEAAAQHVSRKKVRSPQSSSSRSRSLSPARESAPAPEISKTAALNLFDLASLLPPPIRAAPSNDPKLVRTNKDIKGAVKQWCNPATKAAALIKFGHISDWNMSKVTDCSWLFYNQKEFNDDISRWDTSNVKNMSTMFYNAATFNQPIGNWNVAKVTNMFDMFSHAILFNKPLEKWDVTNVKTMRRMFQAASAFNQPISNWNVSASNNMDDMFLDAASFRQKWPSSARASPPAPDLVKRNRRQGGTHNSENAQTKKQRETSLKSEGAAEGAKTISTLTENSASLQRENAALKEKLKAAEQELQQTRRNLESH